MWNSTLLKTTAAVAALTLVAAGSAFAQTKTAPKTEPKSTAAPKAPAKPEAKPMAGEKMSEGHWYMVVSPHTKEQCMMALEGAGSKGAAALAQWDWGCKYGDHTGYLKVRAANKEEALKQVPAELRSQAKVMEIGKFTEADLKSMHSMMKK